MKGDEPGITSRRRPGQTDHCVYLLITSGRALLRKPHKRFATYRFYFGVPFCTNMLKPQNLTANFLPYSSIPKRHFCVNFYLRTFYYQSLLHYIVNHITIASSVAQYSCNSSSIFTLRTLITSVVHLMLLRITVSDSLNKNSGCDYLNSCASISYQSMM
jgi:hypothetical protein